MPVSVARGVVLLRASAGVRDAVIAVAYLAGGSAVSWFLPDTGVSWDTTAPPALPTQVVALVLACAGLLLRHRRPGAGLLLALAGAGVSALIGRLPFGLLLVLGDLLYCAMLHGSRRTARVVGTATTAVVAGVTLVSLVLLGAREAFLTLAATALLPAVPVLWGHEVRQHRDQARRERERADEQRRMAELDRQAALTAERTRMARDLHDVVAGHLSAMALQSEAALRLADTDPAVLRRVMEVVREHSVASLAEMRTMIGLLRSDEPRGVEPRTAPAGLAQLAALVRAARAGGQDVELDDRRPSQELPAAVDLAAYRIAQEGLTNAAKHAPGSPVQIDLSLADGAAGPEVRLRMRNGLPERPVAADGTGTGLLGMRERVDAVGGTLTAGPRAGVWEVDARLRTAQRNGAEGPG